MEGVSLVRQPSVGASTASKRSRTNIRSDCGRASSASDTRPNLEEQVDLAVSHGTLDCGGGSEAMQASAEVGNRLTYEVGSQLSSSAAKGVKPVIWRARGEILTLPWHTGMQGITFLMGKGDSSISAIFALISLGLMVVAFVSDLSRDMADRVRTKLKQCGTGQ